MKMKITRRNAIRYMGAGALAGAGLSPIRLTGQAAKRPNVIFILIDDQRYDAMSCAGHPFFKSPNMDRLANEGVRFTNTFVTNSLCSPSRACFLTGLYNHCNGVTNNGYQKKPLPTTFLEHLQGAGYETAFMGKWHIGGLKVPRPSGVDQLVTFISQGLYNDNRLYINGRKVKDKGYITDRLTDYSLEFLDRPRNRPFCLYLSHKAVHSPMTPPPRFEGLYANAEVKLPPEYGSGDKHEYNLMHTAVMGMREREDIVPIIRSYYETLAAVDESLGRVLDYLDDKGLAQNTLVVFAGDNGFFWGEHDLVDKRFAYEESMRIPFLARWPGVSKNPGRKNEEMVLNIDLAPTILEAAGIPVPSRMHGKSFLPLIQGKQISMREAFLYEYFRDMPWPVPPLKAVRTREWKYITYHKGKIEDELFNLVEDPREQLNLINDPAASDRKEELKAQLERLRKEIKNC